jgi:hypothetical protein
MGRHPDGATARTEWLRLRITREGLAEIDRVRGDETVSAFVRNAVADRIRRVDQLTGKVKR